MTAIYDQHLRKKFLNRIQIFWEMTLKIWFRLKEIFLKNKKPLGQMPLLVLILHFG